MTLPPCKKCEVCVNKKHCPDDIRDMISAMGSEGIENTCVAFKATELMEDSKV